MLRYDFFAPAIKGLNHIDAARVTVALDAAVLFGAIRQAEANGVVVLPSNKSRYNELISRLNTGETFGVPLG